MDPVSMENRIRRRVRKVAEQSGYTQMPRVFFSWRAWMANGGRRSDFTKYEGHVRGMADPDQNMLFFETRSLCCWTDALDAICHEVIHLRWPGLPHGSEFWARKKALIAGTKFGPSRRPLPPLNEFRTTVK